MCIYISIHETEILDHSSILTTTTKTFNLDNLTNIQSLHDASGAVHEKVRKKVLSNERIPTTFRDTIAKTVAKVASDVVTAQQVAQKMGTKLSLEIPKKLKEKGITVEAEEVFQEGVLVVLQLQVTHVDALVLAQAKVEKESIVVAWVRWILCMIGLENKDALEKEYLPALVTEKLTEFMKPAMEKKLLEKNLKAEAHIMAEKDQARFFFHLLKEIREAKEAEKQEKRKPGSSLLSNFGKKKESDISEELWVQKGRSKTKSLEVEKKTIP